MAMHRFTTWKQCPFRLVQNTSLLTHSRSSVASHTPWRIFWRKISLTRPSALCNIDPMIYTTKWLTPWVPHIISGERDKKLFFRWNLPIKTASSTESLVQATSLRKPVSFFLLLCPFTWIRYILQVYQHLWLARTESVEKRLETWLVVFAW